MGTDGEAINIIKILWTRMIITPCFSVAQKTIPADEMKME